VLRIEDHDRGRSRAEYEEALLDDLDWLGFAPDEGPTGEFRRGPATLRQSDSGPRYEAALAQLRASGLHLYGCDCSRRTMDREGGDRPDQETRYAGRCRERGLAPGPGVGLRLQIEPGEESFTDLILGPQRQEPARQCGDLLLRDRLGNWTYQFAVVVDDMSQGITHVIRGEDLLASTGRQILLARLLGRATAPRFAHHCLIRHPSGEKLSKANRDTSIRELRAAGHSAAELIGQAAAGSGLVAAPSDLTATDLRGLFSTPLPFE